MTLFCFYCGYELRAFSSLRTVYERGRKREMTVACADLDACKVRRDERDRAARNAEPVKATR